MKIHTTDRGFGIIDFVDCYGSDCVLQESSSAEERRIWFGAKELIVQEFKAHEGWNKVEYEHTMTHHFVGNERMHLNQKQVKKLLPILQHFADTGELPSRFKKI